MGQYKPNKEAEETKSVTQNQYVDHFFSFSPFYNVEMAGLQCHSAGKAYCMLSCIFLSR